MSTAETEMLKEIQFYLRHPSFKFQSHNIHPLRKIRTTFLSTRSGDTPLRASNLCNLFLVCIVGVCVITFSVVYGVRVGAVCEDLKPASPLLVPALTPPEIF